MKEIVTAFGKEIEVYPIGQTVVVGSAKVFSIITRRFITGDFFIFYELDGFPDLVSSSIVLSYIEV